MHHPTSFCLKWEIWNPVRLFLLDIPWFAFLKMFQTAQVSWMSRWVPERRTTEKNSDTGYIAMFLLGQRHSFIKITAPKCFQRRFRWNLDTTNLRGAYDWVGVVSNCLMGVFWVLGGKVGPSFPRKVVLNKKNGRASTAPSKWSDSVIRSKDPVSNVLAGK